MKIVIAVHHFPPRYTGGAELRAYRTASWLQDHGHEVHVICVEATDTGNGHGLNLLSSKLSYNTCMEYRIVSTPIKSAVSKGPIL